MSRSARHTAGLRRGVTQARSAVRATYGPSQPPQPVCRQYSAAQGLLRVQGCGAFAQGSSLLGAYIPVSVHVPPEVQKDGGAGPDFPAARHHATKLTKVLRAGSADRQGVPLLDGELPVGGALLCSKSLRQRLAAPLLVALGLGDRTR
jgi:hypothetical protein